MPVYEPYTHNCKPFLLHQEGCSLLPALLILKHETLEKTYKRQRCHVFANTACPLPVRLFCSKRYCGGYTSFQSNRTATGGNSTRSTGGSTASTSSQYGQKTGAVNEQLTTRFKPAHCCRYLLTPYVNYWFCSGSG